MHRLQQDNMGLHSLCEGVNMHVSAKLTKTPII